MLYMIKKAMVILHKMPYGNCSCSGILIYRNNGTYVCLKCHREYLKLTGYDTILRDKFVRINWKMIFLMPLINAMQQEEFDSHYKQL